jgi:hypothetical protein
MGDEKLSFSMRVTLAAAGVWGSCAALPALAGAMYQPIRLEDFGKSASGVSFSSGMVINNAGLVGGYAEYPPGGDSFYVSTLWPSGGTAVVRLADLGPNSTGNAQAGVHAINASGLAGGLGSVYATSGDYLGTRALLWPAGGTSLVQLDNLGTDAAGHTQSGVGGINAAGDVYGGASKYVNGNSLGMVPVKWPAGQTTPVELSHLSDGPSGVSNGYINAINDKGDLVGTATKYVNGTSVGTRGVRWTNDGATIQELPTLSPTSTGFVSVEALAVSSNRTIVGLSAKYSADTFEGIRPVQWSADGTQITELAVLPHAGADRTDGEVEGINSKGDRVGLLSYYSGEIPLGDEAVIWPAGSNTPISLNSLIDPNSGWYLSQAFSINDSGVIVGTGGFDPDGPGPAEASPVAFRLDPIPEPALLPVAALFGICIARRRRGGLRRDIAPRN